MSGVNSTDGYTDSTVSKGSEDARLDRRFSGIHGTKRRFNSDTSYQEIPKFWAEYMAQGEKCPIMGTFGFCVGMGGKDFDYWIADLYKPWEDIPEDCETYQIPGSLWAQFICKGQLPDSPNIRLERAIKGS